uniref:uncharacterized protein LOC120341101 n=1 Tax=Styela clava TaxID=7725 RepID=UPI00193990CC|nr:uncharacterized protein LOC120341101 [Styela clava]
MTEQQNDNAIDLRDLKEWEKAAILQVLERNQRVRKLEERRITQLCVRLQLNRMSDNRYSDMERIVLTHSGSWIKEATSRKPTEDPIQPLRKLLTNTIKSIDPEKLKPPKSTVDEHQRNTLGTRIHVDRLRGLSGTEDDEDVKIEEVASPSGERSSTEKSHLDYNDDGFVSCGSESDMTN